MDLDWIVRPGYSLGGHILGCSQHLASCLQHSAPISPVGYAKFESIRYFIDIDILQNCLIDIDIDIFQNHHLDIDIDIDIFGIALSNCTKYE